MAPADHVAFSAAAFIAALFPLEVGAENFIGHTAVLARRIGISETTIGLLTAGGEWEELVVVVSSLARGRSSLAIGNTVGSAISNILGAFSLGLLFHTGEAVEFDRSSRIYSLALLVLTTFACPIAYFPQKIAWLVCGPILITLFGVYVILVGLAIGRGVLTAPEDSDSDSDSDIEESDGDHSEPTSTTGLLAATEPSPTPGVTRHRRRHTLWYHAFYLLFGIAAIFLAGYVLSQAATSIIDQAGISDVFFGIIILSIATTLPEKFVAIMSGYRGHPGILVANTVGSNIFLLSLCLGIVMTDTKGSLDAGNVRIVELAVLWCSTLGLALTVWFGGQFPRYIGLAMLAAYFAFLGLEFKIMERVTH